jgi:hypothetical protein
VPEPPYSYLPYVYAAVLLCGFAWSAMWSARTPALLPEIPADLSAPLPNETD